MPVPEPPADPGERPALLVALGPSFDKFQAVRDELAFRDYALDSGAFLAMTEGRPVRVEDWIPRVRAIQASDPACAEVFALDVIGDHRASLANYAAIRRAGIDAIPTYHFGEPWEVLDELARDYGKIALGGFARRFRRLSQREAWASECLQRIWPKRVHGFGYSAPSLERLPFHSIDASTWAYAPKGFGKYLSMGSKQLSIRGRPNIRVEVEGGQLVEADGTKGVAEQKGCGARYYQRDVDQVEGKFPSRVNCNCGAALFANENLVRYRKVSQQTAGKAEAAQG